MALNSKRTPDEGRFTNVDPETTHRPSLEKAFFEASSGTQTRGRSGSARGPTSEVPITSRVTRVPENETGGESLANRHKQLTKDFAKIVKQTDDLTINLNKISDKFEENDEKETMKGCLEEVTLLNTRMSIFVEELEKMQEAAMSYEEDQDILSHQVIFYETEVQKLHLEIDQQNEMSKREPETNEEVKEVFEDDDDFIKGSLGRGSLKTSVFEEYEETLKNEEEILKLEEELAKALEEKETIKTLNEALKKDVKRANAHDFYESLIEISKENIKEEQQYFSLITMITKMKLVEELDDPNILNYDMKRLWKECQGEDVVMPEYSSWIEKRLRSTSSGNSLTNAVQSLGVNFDVISLKQVSNLYNSLDLDGNGSMRQEEQERLIDLIIDQNILCSGFEEKIRVVKNLIQYVENDDDGELDLGEFTHWYCDLIREKDSWHDSEERQKELRKKRLKSDITDQETKHFSASMLFMAFLNSEDEIMPPEKLQIVWDWIWFQDEIFPGDGLELTTDIRSQLQESLKAMVREEGLYREDFVEWYMDTVCGMEFEYDVLQKKKLGFKQTLRGLIDQYFDPCRYYEVASEELLVVYTEMDKNNIVGKLKHKTRLKVNQRHRQQIHLVEPLIGWVDLRSESQEVLCALLDRADILMEQVNDMSKKVEELEDKLENATSSLEHKEKKEKSSLAEHNEMRDLENILDKKEEECEVLEMEVQKLKKQVKILSDETEHNEILNKLNKANKKLEDVNNTLINLHNTTVTGNEVKRKEELKPVAEQNNYGGEAIDFDNNISEEAEKLKEEVSILQTQIAKQADAIAIKEQMMDQVKDSLSGLGFKELNFDSANSIPKLRAQLTILTKQIQGFRKKQELLED